MDLPKTYDTRWYRGATFNPLARGTPEVQSHVPEGGNVSEEGANALPGWLIAKFAEVAAERKAMREAAEHEAYKMKQSSLLNETDNFLRLHGCRLKRARGGSILK